jgi:serine/threonine-protein kinase
MSEEHERPSRSTLSFTKAAHVDALCDRFEADWRAGRRPSIQEVIAEITEPTRTALLGELLTIEVAWRRRNGEQPVPPAYVAQFPQDTELVESAFDKAETAVAKRVWDNGVPTPHDREPGDVSPDVADRTLSGPGAMDEGPGLGIGSGSVRIRYQILRRHARGGLGEVFVAHDEVLNREVALKEVRADHATDLRCRTRFVREAEITGGLKHPGIVPIYGLGRHDDGRPFYVMPFIRGRSLDDAIEQFHKAKTTDHDASARAVEFRQLLARFLQVCNAIDYAHSQGVLHRDLKPANVMLGPFGETLVVDWGLAKVLDHPGETGGPERETPVAGAPPPRGDTVPGSALGTPQYMSPEQAAGRLDLLAAQSDVYSLGATLYCLLTGRAPFEGKDRVSLMERVRKGVFAAPLARDRKIPRPLEAICLKAMALHPGDRYPSARRLADDIERWLADEPVSAYREPPLRRLAQWGRHHRPVVTGLAALFLTAVAALAVTTVLVGRERLREAQQRKRAEVNLVRARDAVDQMLSEVGAIELADVPQMETARKRLLEKALGFYQEFLSERHDDSALAIEVGRAHSRLAAVQDLLGNFVAAERSYRQAIARFERLAASAPIAAADPDLARACDSLGVLLKKANRFQEAENLLRTALDLHERLAADHPERLGFQQGLAESRYHLGTVLARLPGRQREDEDAYRAAVKIQESLVAATRGQPDARRKLARSLNNLGLLLADAGRVDEAESHYREAAKIQQALLAEDAQAPGNRWHLARSEANLAVLLQATGRLRDAEERFKQARDLQARLVADFPNIPDYRHELAASLYNLGLLLAVTQRPQLAEQAYRESLALSERLRDDFPEFPDYRQKIALTKLNLALVLEKTDLPAAERTYRDALDIQESLAASFPRVFEYRLALGRTLYTFAGLHIRRGELANARRLLERAILQHRAALEFNGRSYSCREFLRDDHGVLAVVLLRLGEHGLAAKAAAELPRILPDNAFEYARSAGFLAECAVQAKRDEKLEEAQRHEREEDYSRRAVDLLRRAFESGQLRDPTLLEQPEFRQLRSRDDFNRLKSDWKQATSHAVG